MKIPRNLYNHEFNKKVHNNLRPILEKFKFEDLEWEEVNNDDERMFRVKKPPQLNRLENYHLSVFQYLANILETIEKLNDIQVYINRFPTPRAYKKKGITQDKWIKYHYGNFVSAIITIYDTSLLLANELFLLGLDPRDCREQIVTRNSYIAHSPTGEAFKELRKVIEEYKYPRNRQLHRGDDPKVGILQYHEMASLLQSSGTPIIEAKELDKLYVLARSYVVEDLEFRTQQIISVLSKFFDSLIDHYDLQTEAYGLKDALSNILPSTNALFPEFKGDR